MLAGFVDASMRLRSNQIIPNFATLNLSMDFSRKQRAFQAVNLLFQVTIREFDVQLRWCLLQINTLAEFRCHLLLDSPIFGCAHGFEPGKDFPEFGNRKSGRRRKIASRKCDAITKLTESFI